jgi:hypothetical protein
MSGKSRGSSRLRAAFWGDCPRKANKRTFAGTITHGAAQGLAWFAGRPDPGGRVAGTGQIRAMRPNNNRLAIVDLSPVVPTRCETGRLGGARRELPSMVPVVSASLQRLWHNVIDSGLLC